ncbi:hypothetical protein E2L00_06200 [Cedecea colo]|uniref:Uncharacterized protein n=1 Tax=Cedecea colo TaxID=2552946 RepID=A0ABX0VJK9_9ENTR|nr:hypothetical protein [Cedecea colo]
MEPLFYTRHPANCRGVGCILSPESLTLVSSSGLFPCEPLQAAFKTTCANFVTRLPPGCNSHLIGRCFSSQTRYYMVFVKVRVITSCCCSLVRELKRTA